MIKKNTKIFICVSLLIIFVLMLPIFYLKINFKTNYSLIIKENLSNITLNNNCLNKNFVLSVIKAESSFNERAKSTSDAFGLMQLTYPTAKETANKIKLDITIEDLYNPNINIKLGINYLNYLFSIFEEKQLVILSYNAGFNKVKTWLENNEIKKENGIYITPYKETNSYIKNVLRNEKIYNIITKE